MSITKVALPLAKQATPVAGSFIHESPVFGRTRALGSDIGLPDAAAESAVRLD
ncbi:MAG: hypothetical protein WDO56_23145 [Gammaproteobacteria bacterium]